MTSYCRSYNIVLMSCMNSTNLHNQTHQECGRISREIAFLCTFIVCIFKISSYQCAWTKAAFCGSCISSATVTSVRSSCNVHWNQDGNTRNANWHPNGCSTSLEIVVTYPKINKRKENEVSEFIFCLLTILSGGWSIKFNRFLIFEYRTKPANNVQTTLL